MESATSPRGVIVAILDARLEHRRFDSGGGLAMSRLTNETATLLASDPVIWETYSTIIDGRDRHQSGGDR